MLAYEFIIYGDKVNIKNMRNDKIKDINCGERGIQDALQSSNNPSAYISMHYFLS